VGGRSEGNVGATMSAREPAPAGPGAAPPPADGERRASVLSRAWRRVRGLDRELGWLAIAFFAYVGGWTYLSLARYYALTATVWDLGAGMQSIWVFTQPQLFTPTGYVQAAAATPMHFLLAPLAIGASYPALLVFQTVALALGAFPVYFIARRLLDFRPAALAFGVAYLLYFPLAGINWFDFHFEALFVPLFLFGYWAYLKRWAAVSLVLLFLGGSTTFPYMGLVGLFGLLSLLELGFLRYRRHQPVDRWVLAFSIAAIVVAGAFLAYQYWYFALAFGGSYLSVGTNTGAGLGFPGLGLGLRLLLLVFFFAPFLFVGLFSPKWWLMLAPIALLILFSSYFGYEYPTLLRDQYLCAAVPFLVIGAIYGVRRAPWLQWGTGPAATAPSDRPVRGWARLRDRRVRYSVAIVVVGVVIATAFQPYGPINLHTPNTFGISNATRINWTEYDQLDALAGLVPPSAPAVLIQNNLPMLLPRPLTYYNTPLTSMLLDWANITPGEVAANAYSVTLLEGSTVATPLAYAVGDPWSSWYAVGAPHSNFSMQTVAPLMYDSGDYGLLGEANGMFALGRGYSGPLEYYVPYAIHVPAGQLATAQLPGPPNVPPANGSGPNGTLLWGGPGTPIVPGTYAFGISLTASATAATDHLVLALQGGAGNRTLAAINVTGSELTGPSVPTEISATWPIGALESTLRLVVTSFDWSGTVTVGSFALEETAPPG